MPSPIKPSTWKAAVNALTGVMCDRMSKLFATVNLKAEEHAYKYNEAGLPTPEFKADLCEALAPCLGDGGSGSGNEEPPNPNMAAPEALSASDDAYSDKIVIDWEPVTEATEYKLYRSTTTSFSGATLIATITAPTIEYEDPVDGDLIAGTKYYYWARATDGTETSALSNRDQGRAASSGEIGELDAISDLTASQGFSQGESTPVKLQWTPPAGATKYEVWRHTANDFSAATKIANNVVPQDPEQNIVSDTSPDAMWDNGVRIVFHHFPPSAFAKYYFWIVAKADSPPAESEESNASQGWVATNYSPYTGGRFTLNRDETAEEGVDFTGTKIRVVLFGGGGAGAGGSEVYGGGGGGASATVVEEFVLSAGDELSLEAVDNVDETPAAAALEDGVDGSTMIFKINGVAKMQCDAGGGGIFSASGGGAGGVENGGSGTTSPTIYPGFAGKAGSGAAGGASGFNFGDRRYPAAHYDNFSLGGWSGDGPAPSTSGGGSYAAPGILALAVGGKGKTGYAVIAFGV